MPRQTNLLNYLHRELLKAGWVGLIYDVENKTLSCSKGIIIADEGDGYRLNFITYSGEPRQYYDREKYRTITFPKTVGMKRYLYFRRNGKYTLSRESQFKKIINPLNREITSIKIINGHKIRRFTGTQLTLSDDFLKSSMDEAEQVYKKRNSYGLSAENYLASQASQKYGRAVRKRTTYYESGEMAFMVDRFNLSTKKKKADFLRFLNPDDISSVENLIERLLRHDVLSDSFIRKINDYFIKERLREIVGLGREILLLGRGDLKSARAKSIIQQMDCGEVKQLETLWQKYFERYLLYLIFSYKKIFPKVELSDTHGDKKYPDFMGINHYNGLDVIEIKTHLTKLLVWDSSHKNFYFSPEVSKAIVQTANYLDAIVQERFKDPSDRRRITDFMDEENLYHPRGIIIISSEGKLTTKNGENEKLKRDFTKLRNGLQNIQILTFDEIINIADEYIKNIIE